MHIGIDLGGTKIAAVALDETGREVGRRRAETPPDYAATLAALSFMVRDLEAEARRAGTVGLCIPGIITPDGQSVRAVNLPWLAGRSFAADVAASVGRPVRLANDANCFALSEATDGAGAGAGVVFGIVLGTGVGGGLVVDGRLLPGFNAQAGEWGHTPLPWRNRADGVPLRCRCGREGCIETVLCGAGLSNAYAAVTGKSAEGHDIAALAEHGDGSARMALGRYLRSLAKALSGIMMIVDPEVIVVGGGLCNLPELYEAVPRLWGNYTLSAMPRTRLVRAQHGGDSGVRGAAWLWR